MILFLERYKHKMKEYLSGLTIVDAYSNYMKIERVDRFPLF